MNLFDEFTGIDDSYFFSDPFLADLGQAQGRFQSKSTAMQSMSHSILNCQTSFMEMIINHEQPLLLSVALAHTN